MLQLLSPKVERPPGYFPMRPDRRTLEQTSELSSRPEEMIRDLYLTSDQLPAQPEPLALAVL